MRKHTITLAALEPLFDRWRVRMAADAWPECDPDNIDPDNPNCADMLADKKNAKKTWFTMLANAQDADVADISIYDMVGYWGVTAADFRDSLQALGDQTKTINLRINSPGGEVFDGIAIYNMLQRHPAVVNVTVDGLAASIASLIAMCGDKVMMPENSMMMIHNPAGMAMGTAEVMRELADALDKIRDAVVTSYVSKTGMTADKVTALMKAETWMTAKEAKDLGFADEVVPARNFTNLFDLSKFQNPPKMAAAASWKVGASKDLPLDPSYTWDGPAAAERMLDKAGFNGDTPNASQAARGFLVHDAANLDEKGSYKLPFADIIGGELKASAGGLRAAASRLPQTDIPEATRTEARTIIDHYQAHADHPANARSRKRTAQSESKKPANELLAKAQDLDVRSQALGEHGPGDAVAQALLQESRDLLDEAEALGDEVVAEQVSTMVGLVQTLVTSKAKHATEAPPADPAVRAAAEERTRCGEIAAACELAGHPARAAAFIAEGKTLTEVMSSLRSTPRGRSGEARDELSARHGGLSETVAPWGPVIDRINHRITGG